MVMKNHWNIFGQTTFVLIELILLVLYNFKLLDYGNK